jgi:hypothetical protein
MLGRIGNWDAAPENLVRYGYSRVYYGGLGGVNYVEKL